MSELGPQTSLEETLLSDTRRFRVVAVIAGVVSVPFMLSHLYFAFVQVPSVQSMFRSMGGTLPVGMQWLFNLNQVGVVPVALVLVDVAVFALMYRLAKRYWIGLLFVPIPIYLGMTSVFTPLLYWPLTNVIQLIQ